MRANLSSIQTKIMPIVFGLALFAIAFSAVKGMVHGNATNVKMLAALVVAGGLVFALDKYYWLMYPAFSTIDIIKIPGLPFSGSELGCLFIVAVYILRLVLQKETTTKPSTALLLCFPFLLWIIIVWCLNPTGLAMFGSTTIGGRFYLKMVLGFLACCVMCTKAINEKDAKKLFVVILLSQVIGSIITLFLSSSLVVDELESDSGGTKYKYLFALSFCTLMFCRYSLFDIFKSGWKFFVVVFLALLTIYTGKRKAIGILLLLPILRVYFTGKDKMLTFAGVCIASFVLCFAVVADGVFYELPQSVKRSLSVVVPKYRQSDVALDVFRYEMRRYGKELIKESPLVGRKGFAMDLREVIWLNSTVEGVPYEGHAYAGNWHSTWFAYACDFGLPCMILFVFPFVYSLIYSYRVLKKCKYGSWSFVSVLYFSFSLYTFAIFSYTTGHSSGSTTTILYYISFLVALDNGLKQDRKQRLITS